MALNDKHKDRVFKFIFGSPENKKWTLDLYNAINSSHYTNPDDIQFNTIEDAVYLGMKNDVSFIILNEMNLWEHQSTYNPNMPMRFFIYAAKLYEKYIANSDYYQYSMLLQSAPRPRCVCFYNGMEWQPEEKFLMLSEAFGGKSDIEVRVKMLNINYGKNRTLMEVCQPLNEYAWLVDKIRLNKKSLKNMEAAVDAAIRDMPDDFVIKKFLLLNKAEVKGMFLTEYDQDKVLEQERRESTREGMRRGRREFAYNVAENMLKEGEPLEKIIMYSKLAEKAIRKIASRLGITVV